MSEVIIHKKTLSRRKHLPRKAELLVDFIKGQFSVKRNVATTLS